MTDRYDTPTAFPLAWPAGWPRTAAAARKTPPWFRQAHMASGKSRRELTAAGAIERLQAEIDRLRASTAILSTNMELRLDGQPRASAKAPDDPGAAIYFTLNRRPIALACDRWNTVAGNIAALAAHLGAMRAMDRWGVGSVEKAFTGYAALPAPIVPDDWRIVLDNPATLGEAEATYRARMRRAHPDQGGMEAEAARLNVAIAAARAHWA